LNIHNALALITAPAPRLAGPRPWHWIIFFVAAAALIALVLPAILKWQRSRRRQVMHLELINHGNVRSRYALHAAEPSGNLGFHFLLNGMSLPKQTVTLGTHGVAPESKEWRREGKGAAGASTAKTGTAQTKSFQQTLSSTAQTGGTFANLLSTVGRMLPASLGRPLINLSTNMRKGQQFTSRAKQASQYAGQLQSQGKRPTRQPAPSTATVGTAPAVVPTVVEMWAHTPFVEPSQKTVIDLSILPHKAYQHGYYTYTVRSRSVEHKEAPETLETYTLQLDPLNPFDRYAPFLGFAICLIIALSLFLSLW